jgi:hypothetical protein
MLAVAVAGKFAIYSEPIDGQISLRKEDFESLVQEAYRVGRLNERTLLNDKVRNALT